MIEFRLLGSLEVVEDGRPLVLGPPNQRTLLAALLVHRRETVSTDRLIDELWGERAPPTARKIIQGYVSNLRKVLGEGLLVSRGQGYVLQVDPAQTDVDRFESLATEGHRALAEGDPHTAAERFREALALWRGPALEDFVYASFAQSEIARLEEARLAALEERIDAELALGEHTQLVGELELLVRENPLRERLVAQLMLALYRSGRQADALAAFREAKARLVDELGLDPGPELQGLERAILVQDPALQAPPARRTVPEAPAAVRSRRRGGALMAVGGAVLLAVIVAIALTVADSGASAVTVAPNSLAAIDPGTDRVVGAVAVGDRPGAVAFASGSVWTANLDDQTISRVDPRTMRVQRVITLPGPPTGIVGTADGPWVVQATVNPESNAASSVSVSRIDPEFYSLGPVVRIGNVIPDSSGAIAARGNSIWVAPYSGLLTHLDATTGAVIGGFDPNASPGGDAITPDGAVWLTDSEADVVVRRDPTGLLKSIPVGNTPTAIAAGAGAVWVVDSLDNAVVRIDQSSQSVTGTFSVGDSPAGIAVGDGSVWVANAGDGTVTRLDATTGRVQTTIHVGGSPAALTVADGRVWVAVDAQATSPSSGGSNGGTLRIVSGLDVDSMDPAIAATGLSWQLEYATCAKLLNYPDRAGAAGAQLVPEAAQALPTRSPDGRTYTFTIRPGFRFSPPSDQPVTAQTFKYTIERTLNPKMQSPFAQFLGDVVGADAYMAGKASGISGVIANGNKLIIRLRTPEPSLLSRIALPGFCAVPTDTPIDPAGEPTVPSAGPYYVASHTPGQGVVLLRNPNYHGKRPRHFARIELTVGVGAPRAISEIKAGTADYVTIGGYEYDVTPGIAALASSLAARFGPGSAAASHGRQQYFVTPALALDFFYLNTHRTLFSDVRVRQAVNYAINRQALAAAGGGFDALPDTPTDHYLPPGMPGYRAAHVYPLTPDLAKARQLIAAAHAAGRTAVLFTLEAAPSPEQAQIVKNDLLKIGLNVQVQTFSDDRYFALLANPREPFDLAWDGWLADYPDPDDFLNNLLENSANGPTFIDPGAQQKLAAAERLTGPQRYLTYGALDLDLARNAAPLAAYGNLSSHDFFSARIGCQAFGIYGMDLAALCTRAGAR
ncbi:MAG TPA: ABC transporter substrate-binding protein [Solirubrobacteraceae bacterium]|nr:ABC transporter substrate-binding protein [Solirubrobacteraceae bacterium]